MTIAVIGHGRSPEGKNWGSRIDSCCTVIRMWDWEWQSFPDYGDKYDIGLFVLTPKSFYVFEKFNQNLPNRGWLAYVGKETECKLPNQTRLVDPTPWVELGRAFGGVGLSGRLTLTRGCVAAAWAIGAARKGEPVVLVGFDNVLAGTNKPISESFNPLYWKLYNGRFEGKLEKTYPVGQPKTETHDMAVEGKILARLAEGREVDLWYAQERW